MDIALIICKWLQYLSAMLLLGSPLFRGLLGAAAVPIDRDLTLWLKGSAVLAMVSSVCWLMLVAGGMGNGWVDAINPSTLWLVLRATVFGHVWTLHLILGTLLLVGIFLPGTRFRSVMVGLAALYLASLALTGHAVMESGAAGFMRALAQVLHLLGGGAWIGALLPLLLCLRRAEVVTVSPLAIHATRSFSRLGYPAVALVVLSGLWNSLPFFAAPQLLVGTLYGQVLLVKVGLVALMLACALLNRFRFASRLEEGSLIGLRTSVLIETGTGMLVLVAAGYLGHLPPPF